MKNLKQLIRLKSDKSGDEIITYLKEQFENYAQEVQIVKNKENNDKSLLVGINTSLVGAWPHRACRTH